MRGVHRVVYVPFRPGTYDRRDIGLMAEDVEQRHLGRADALLFRKGDGALLPGEVFLGENRNARGRVGLVRVILRVVAEEAAALGGPGRYRDVTVLLEPGQPLLFKGRDAVIPGRFPASAG